MNREIVVRKIPFEFNNELTPIWNPALPEWSHMVNGASLVMPYLEPFLNKNILEALSHLDNEALQKDAQSFIGQEAQHYTNHRRYNSMLKKNGYPELEALEQRMRDAYKQLSTRSLNWRLAYTAGFETMTIGLTEWLIDERVALFGDADPLVSSLILWHMVEETEHKSVAFDVFKEVSGSFFLRVFGLLYASFHVAFLTRRGYRAMLIKDGRWGRLRTRIALWKMVGRFYLKVAPAMLRSLNPAYHPNRVSDPSWIDQWQTAYANMSGENIPLLQTHQGVVEPVS